MTKTFVRVNSFIFPSSSPYLLSQKHYLAALASIMAQDTKDNSNTVTVYLAIRKRIGGVTVIQARRNIQVRLVRGEVYA